MIKLTYGLDDNPDAKLIREEVFVLEQGFHEEFDAIDDHAWHVVLYQDGEPVATGRTFAQDGIYHIGRVAVRKKFRGSGLGAHVMAALETKLRDLGASRVELSAQLQAQGFYQKIGYHAQGDIYLDEHCPHICMWKDLTNESLS